MADTSGASVGRDRGRPRPARGAGATRAGVPTKTVSVDETPKAYGSCARCKVRRSVALSPNSASPSTAVTVIPLARTCRSNVQRELPLRLPADTGRNAGARALRWRQPRLGEIQRRAQHPRLCPRPQRDRHRRLAVGDFPQRAAVLPRHADRVRPLLRKARAVENEDARAIGNRGAQVSPHGVGRPRRIGDEMLKRLIRARIADALQHRAHRFAAAVAQQPEQVAAKRAALRHVREAHLERLEPSAQAIEPRRRTARESRQHRAAAYRTRGTSTSPLSRVPSDSGINLTI